MFCSWPKFARSAIVHRELKFADEICGIFGYGVRVRVRVGRWTLGTSAKYGLRGAAFHLK